MSLIEWFDGLLAVRGRVAKCCSPAIGLCDKCSRLYEQERCTYARLESYIRRWKSWVSGGLPEANRFKLELPPLEPLLN